MQSELERNASGRRARLQSAGVKSSIAGSAAEGDDSDKSLHGAGVGVCSNELEGVGFASSRNFTRGSVPREKARPCTAMTNLSSHAWTCSVASAEVWYRNQLCSING